MTLSAVHAEFFGWPIDRSHFFAHHEWAPSRKIDPWGPSRYAGMDRWNMNAFRDDVLFRWTDLYTTTPPPIDPPPSEEDEDMQVRFTTTNRVGQFLIGSGLPVFLSNDMVDEQYHAVPKVVGSGADEDARWDEYLAVWNHAHGK